MTTGLANFEQLQRNHLLNWLPLLSQAFWGPTEEWCVEICSAATTGELADFGKLVGSEKAAASMTAFIKSLACPDELCRTLEQVYVRLFVSDFGGIKAPLYQSCYEAGNGMLLGRPAKMMEARLKAAGLSLPQTTSVPADHLAVQVEYLTLLLDRAFAESGEAFKEAARDFAALELSPWLTRFVQRLHYETGSPFYPAVAHLLLAVVHLVAALPGQPG
jgi:putative dimethyl sulfoxide reductase chaperone